MTNTRYFKSSSPRKKALIQSTIYFITIEIILTLITSTFIPSLSFIGEV